MDIQLIALYTAPATALIALAYGFFLSKKITSQQVQNEKLKAIGKAISDGAMAYLKKQFSIVIPIMALLSAVIAVGLGLGTAITFLMGAIFSGIIGYLGMAIAVKANVRTAENALQGLNPALKVAFSAGTVNGMLVVGLGLLGVSLIYMYSYFTYIAQGPEVVSA